MNMLKQQELRYRLNSDSFKNRNPPDQGKIKPIPTIVTILLALLFLLISRKVSA